MTGVLLFSVFIVLLLAGVPIGVALGIGGAIAIAVANTEAQLWGLFAVPQNFYASIAKYPLLALPMFVLVGAIFDRSGVAQRMMTFAIAVVGRGSGMLPVVAISVAMVLGGISGSGPANAAAVGGVMIAAMVKAGYPAPFSASVIGAAAATDILIPPSIAFIVYSVMVPGASVPALFAAGMIPGVLAGLALIVPAVWLSRKHGFGGGESALPRPPFWHSLKEAVWGLAAPVLILGLAGIFAYSVNTLGIADPIAAFIAGSGLGSFGAIVLVSGVLVIVGMFLDGVSIFLIFLPLLAPVAKAFSWDPVWFGVILTMLIAVGQFKPPMAVNLMVACRVAHVPMESTLPWIGWLVASFLAVTFLVIVFPELALWLPRSLGY